MLVIQKYEIVIMKEMEQKMNLLYLLRLLINLTNNGVLTEIYKEDF